MFKKLSLVLLISLFIIGCGKTNVLQWAKAPDKSSDIEMARKYLDEGDYSKAKSYVQNSTSNEGRILYAECLMGESGVDLSTIIATLTDEKISNNPVLRLEPLITDNDKRTKILEAAEIFVNIMPSKTSDKIIGTLCTMIGHVGLIKEAFAPTTSFAVANTTYAGSTATITLPVPFGTQNINEANVDTQFDTLTTSAGGNPLNYIKRSSTLLSSIGSVPQEVKDSVVSLNATLDTIYNTCTTTTDVNIEGTTVNVNLSDYNVMPWSFAKALCGF